MPNMGVLNTVSSQNTETASAVRVETAGAIARLTLSRPERRNVLSEEMMAALSDALARVAAEPEVRVVVLAAAGSVFCAGHDLKEMGAHRADPDRGCAYFATIMTRCTTLMRQIVRLPKPVIAEVRGMATAAGCQLVASCDLAVASREAHFCTPGVHIGLFCSTPMVALSRTVGRKHAMEMLLTGEAVDAETAWRFGLVNRTVAEEDLGDTVEALARTIAAKSPIALRTGKEAFQAQAEMALDDAYAYTAQVMVENMLAADAEEGIAAFFEKRAPRWGADGAQAVDEE